LPWEKSAVLGSPRCMNDALVLCSHAKKGLMNSSFFNPLEHRRISVPRCGAGCRGFGRTAMRAARYPVIDPRVSRSDRRARCAGMLPRELNRLLAVATLLSFGVTAESAAGVRPRGQSPTAPPKPLRSDRPG
jgi:hypothetical protein